MIEILFGSGIALAVYFIFLKVNSLTGYADIFFWVFIAVLIVFGITVIIKAVLAIKTSLTNRSKGRQSRSGDDI